MTGDQPPTPLDANAEDLPAIGLQTGYLDDVRKMLTGEHENYRLFRWARENQDAWTDSVHRGFWLPRLHLWPSKPGNWSTEQSITFLLAVGLSDGFTLPEIAAELPLRSRDVLRDRYLKNATKWREALDRPSPPGMPKRDAQDKVCVIPGSDRRWRLPRVYVEDEERMLPQPPGHWDFGWINLPPLDTPLSSLQVGGPALEVFEEICGALTRLRQRRGWPDLRAQAARCTRVELCEEPIQSQRGSRPPLGEIGCDPFEWETRRRRVADLVEVARYLTRAGG